MHGVSTPRTPIDESSFDAQFRFLANAERAAHESSSPPSPEALRSIDLQQVRPPRRHSFSAAEPTKLSSRLSPSSLVACSPPAVMSPPPAVMPPPPAAMAPPPAVMSPPAQALPSSDSIDRRVSPNRRKAKLERARSAREALATDSLKPSAAPESVSAAAAPAPSPKCPANEESTSGAYRDEACSSATDNHNEPSIGAAFATTTTDAVVGVNDGPSATSNNAPGAIANSGSSITPMMKGEASCSSKSPLSPGRRSVSFLGLRAPPLLVLLVALAAFVRPAVHFSQWVEGRLSPPPPPPPPPPPARPLVPLFLGCAICCVYLLLGVMKSSPALQDAGVGDADAAEHGAPTWMREDERDSISKSPARLTRRE